MQATDPAPHHNPAHQLGLWLRLQLCAGVGPVHATTLLSRYASPDAIFGASMAELEALVGPRLARHLLSEPDAATLAIIGAALAWQEQPDQHLIARADPAYSHQLLNIDDAPILLYVKGKLELLSRRALALVGSRNASVQGMANARTFAQALSGAGFTIVSGLAQGIDAAAHQGGLVSEYPLGCAALRDNFPRRNRIISGLSEGVLVVEAALQSGSLITARLANDQGRAVYAMPGSIHAPLAKGCHQLIRSGAKLVDTVADIVAELPMPIPGCSGALAPAHLALLDALGFEAVDPGLLAGAQGCDIGLLNSHLLLLELGGHLARLPGGRVQRIVR